MRGRSTLGMLLMLTGLSEALWASQTLVIQQSRDLQPALDKAAPGDTIVVAAGVTFTGNFLLPFKNQAGIITIRSSRAGELPEGRRVSPEDVSKMATWVSPSNGPVLATAPYAHDYRLIGIVFRAAPGIYSQGLVSLGSLTTTNKDSLPFNLELDRVVILGDPAAGAKRGVFLNTGMASVKNSYIAEIKSKTQDAQAICACNATGPIEIQNNYLEASGENVMFGGCVTGIIGIVPSDITVVRNHLFKPLGWKQEGWFVKNLFEVKNGRRIRIDGNRFENNWTSAQNGFGILFTPRADGRDEKGRAFGIAEDISFTNNSVINSDQGLNIMGRDEGKPSSNSFLRGLTVRNNLFEKIPGRMFQTIRGPRDVTVDHNTCLGTNDAFWVTEDVTTGLVVTNNILLRGEYGLHTSSGEGSRSFPQFFPGGILQGNVIVGGDSQLYGGNYTPANLAAVGFTDPAGGNYNLGPRSQFRGKGRDGRDPGIDFAALQAAQAGVVQTSRRP